MAAAILAVMVFVEGRKGALGPGVGTPLLTLVMLATVAALLHTERAEGESATLREQVESEREGASRAEAERDAARAEREAAKVAAAAAKGEAKGLRLALEEAQRPFWKRWLG